VAAAPRAPRAAPRPSVQAPPDVPALQTAAALANTLGSFWRSALALPFVGGPAALPAVASLAARCGQLAGDHADALNAAATARGGAAQTATDPTYQVTVDKALPTLSDAGLAVGVAITLTDLALQTVTALVSEVDAGDARQLLASVGCVLGARTSCSPGACSPTTGPPSSVTPAPTSRPWRRAWATSASRSSTPARATRSRRPRGPSRDGGGVVRGAVS